MNEEARNEGKKHQISNLFGSKNDPVVNFFYQKSRVFSTLHTDAHDRLGELSTHHKPHFPQDPKLLSGILTTTRCDPQRSVSPWSAWQPEASAARRSRRGLVCRCRQRSAGCRGCARTATWRRATSGDRVVRRLVCASCFPFMFRLTSLGVSSVSLVCGSTAVMSSAFVPQRSSVDPCCTVSSVRKRLQASGTERQVKNQHLTVQNKRRRLCSSMLERLGETKRLWEVSRKTRRFSGHCSLGSSSHKKLSFLFGFLWLLAVSFAVFFSLFWFRKICTMFLLLLSCSWPNALASRRQLLQKCSSATSSGRTSPFSGCVSSPTIRTLGSVGVSHISQLSRHMSFSQPSARAQHCHPSLQLNVESGFRHIFGHSACGNMVIFSPVPLSVSVSLPRI